MALVIILIDLAGIAEMSNTGGHLGHLGGALGGALFIWILRNGITLLPTKNDKPKGKVIPMRQSMPATAERSSMSSKSNNTTTSSLTKQEEIDRILDKIRAKGIHSLTNEEKEMLDKSAK